MREKLINLKVDTTMIHNQPVYLTENDINNIIKLLEPEVDELCRDCTTFPQCEGSNIEDCRRREVDEDRLLSPDVIKDICDNPYKYMDDRESITREELIAKAQLIKADRTRPHRSVQDIKDILDKEPVNLYPSVEDAKRAIGKRNEKLAREISTLPIEVELERPDEIEYQKSINEYLKDNDIFSIGDLENYTIYEIREDAIVNCFVQQLARKGITLKEKK